MNIPQMRPYTKSEIAAMWIITLSFIGFLVFAFTELW